MVTKQNVLTCHHSWRYRSQMSREKKPSSYLPPQLHSSQRLYYFRLPWFFGLSSCVLLRGLVFLIEMAQKKALPRPPRTISRTHVSGKILRLKLLGKSRTQVPRATSLLLPLSLIIVVPRQWQNGLLQRAHSHSLMDIRLLAGTFIPTHLKHWVHPCQIASSPASLSSGTNWTAETHARNPIHWVQPCDQHISEAIGFAVRIIQCRAYQVAFSGAIIKLISLISHQNSLRSSRQFRAIPRHAKASMDSWHIAVFSQVACHTVHVQSSVVPSLSLSLVY